MRSGRLRNSGSQTAPCRQPDPTFPIPLGTLEIVALQNFPALLQPLFMQPEGRLSAMGSLGLIRRRPEEEVFTHQSPS